MSGFLGQAKAMQSGSEFGQVRVVKREVREGLEVQLLELKELLRCSLELIDILRILLLMNMKTSCRRTCVSLGSLRENKKQF